MPDLEAGRRGLLFRRGTGGKLDALLKTIDSVMRQEWNYRHPVKAEANAKWLLQIIQDEVQRLFAEKRTAEEEKITINYAQLNRIREDAAVAQEKLIV